MVRNVGMLVQCFVKGKEGKEGDDSYIICKGSDRPQKITEWFLFSVGGSKQNNSSTQGKEYRICSDKNFKKYSYQYYTSEDGVLCFSNN